MEPHLKQAYEEGKAQAANEVSTALQEAIKRREKLVGWKEQALTPQRLSQAGKKSTLPP